jgi:hypothetical protein
MGVQICPLRDCHSSAVIQKNLCHMGSQNAHRCTRVKETVTDWLCGLASDFYDEGIIKQHLDECLNHNGKINILWCVCVAPLINGGSLISYIDLLDHPLNTCNYIVLPPIQACHSTQPIITLSDCQEHSTALLSAHCNALLTVPLLTLVVTCLWLYTGFELISLNTCRSPHVILATNSNPRNTSSSPGNGLSTLAV